MKVDRVAIINLRRRQDRLHAAYRRLCQSHWPFQLPDVFDALDGLELPAPVGWDCVGSAPGAWACLQSHLRLLESFLLSDDETMLVLEDDAAPAPAFAGNFESFIDAIPNDWALLMLGGEHVGAEPIAVSAGVVRCTNTHRTHAYLVRRSAFAYRLYQTWGSYVGHCDQAMASLMPRFKVYAPAPFLVGQAAGKSDITGLDCPARQFQEIGREIKC